MIFNEQDIENVERVTLDGKRFNSNQKEYINLFESKYIIAGPGVGKTTCLSAKIVLLLMKLAKENSKEAICIITHTNVAVDEINRILNKMGISKIQHPHFVGTIHQFFNTYLALPYIKKVLNPTNLRFSTEEEHLPILTSLVSKSAYFTRWAQAALIKIKASRLAYDKESKCIILENTTNWDKFEKHKTEMLNLKLQLKRMGYFSFEDTFLFSQAAIGNVNIIRILRKRFKYVFIDEFQDTKPHSINILKEIFMVEGNVLQFIGDPNQTLDFYGEKPEVDQDNTFELKLCNRFGENIARHLPFVINDVRIESIEGKVSFDPLMIIYKENNQLIPFYEKLLEDYANNNEEFRSNDLKNSILSIRNDTIFQFENNDGKQETTRYRIKSNDAFTQHMLRLINELIFKKVSVSRVFDFDLRKFIKNHHEQLNIKKCLINNIKSKKLDVPHLKNCINAILNEQGSSLINSTNDIFNKLSSIIETMDIKLKDENTLEEELKNKLVYSTIHSAKGETHRSALLIDSEKSQMIHTQMLKSFYNNDGINYDINWVERNLLYVAMSRPTHLFAFGMNDSFIESEEVEKFMNLGWRVEYSF